MKQCGQQVAAQSYSQRSAPLCIFCNDHMHRELSGNVLDTTVPEFCQVDTGK